MTYIVLFEDNEDRAHQRQAHMSDHLAFLDQNAQAITAAGPLFEGSGQGAGGLWLVAADSEDAVRALVEADPFWPTGLRKSVRILEWRQVFADGEVLIPR